MCERDLNFNKKRRLRTSFSFSHLELYYSVLGKFVMGIANERRELICCCAQQQLNYYCAFNDIYLLNHVVGALFHCFVCISVLYGTEQWTPLWLWLWVLHRNQIEGKIEANSTNESLQCNLIFNLMRIKLLLLFCECRFYFDLDWFMVI